VRSSTGRRSFGEVPAGAKVNHAERSSPPGRRTATATRDSRSGSGPSIARIFSAERSGSESGASPAMM
jgi:hypothetical protein